MAKTQFIEHVPCPKCASSDAGGRYEDGSCKCHKCGHRWREGAPPADDTQITPVSDLLDWSVTHLPARKLQRPVCEKFLYGWNREADRQVANYCDPKTGDVVAQKLRSPDKSFSWRGDRSRIGLYGEHLWRDAGNMVVVTEGEIDALSVAQAMNTKGRWWPVVSVPDGAGSAAKAVARSLAWLEGFERVVFMFDEDEPGREAAVECARLLSPGKAFIAHLPAKDPNELLKAGRAHDIVDAAWGAKVWRPAGIVTGKDLASLMQTGPEPTVARFPYPELDRMTLGIQKGNIILVVAAVGAGKTTLMKGFANAWLDQGLKLGSIPLEETVKQFTTGLLSSRLGRNLAIEEGLEALPEDFEAELGRIQDRLVFCADDGDRRSGTVIDAARYMALAEKCDLLVIDPITVVIGAAQSDDDRRFAERFMLEVESLGKRTGVPVVIVAHLKKPGDGKAHEEGRRVTMADIRGTGLIGALSHKIIAYERDQQRETSGPPRGTLRMLKNRLTGRVGKADTLAFVEKTGRLEPVPEEGALPPITADELQPVPAGAEPESY